MEDHRICARNYMVFHMFTFDNVTKLEYISKNNLIGEITAFYTPKAEWPDFLTSYSRLGQL